MPLTRSRTIPVGAGAVRAQLASTPSARALGENGLDYHYDFSPHDVQQQVFRTQIRLACELDLPVVIHTREADEDTIAILREEGRGEVRGVCTAYRHRSARQRRARPRLLYLARRIITFPKAAALREAIEQVPLDRLLTETDSPFWRQCRTAANGTPASSRA